MIRRGRRSDLGLDPRGALTFQSRLPANQYFRQVGMQGNFAQLDVSPEPSALFQLVAERLTQLPGVEAAAGS